MPNLSRKLKLPLLNGIGLSFLALAMGGCAPGVEETSQKPNIILIMSDDLGYNDLSFYRNTHQVSSPASPTSQTPNIDLLAGQGLVFTDFYAGAAVCSPSRAALLSGRNASRVGIYNWIPPNSPMHFRDEEVTIAEMLKEQGFQTAHFGKWHLTLDEETQPGPLDQGFDYAYHTFNNAEPSHHNPVNFIRNGNPLGPLEGYLSHLVVDETIGWLKTNVSPDKPFYLNVWFHEPHSVCAAPEEFTSRHPYKKQYYGGADHDRFGSGFVPVKQVQLVVANR